MAERGFFGNRNDRGVSSRRSRDTYVAPPAPPQGGYAPPQAPAGGYVPQTGYAGGYAQGTNNVTIRHPRTYQDVQNLIDRLRMREQVIVDFTTLDQRSVFRILDFLSGAIYALGGSVQQLGENLFLFVPAGVAINVPPDYNGR